MTEANAAKSDLDLAQKLEALEMAFGADYAKSFQDPVIFVPAEFLSPTVKQFYKREFAIVSRTLMVESVYRRRPMYDQSVLDNFAEMCGRKLADILKLLSTQCDRLTMICQSSNADMDATYLHPAKRLVPIIAGPAKGYLQLLLKLDEVYLLTGAATLNGVLDGKARRDMELLCRKAVRAFSAMVRNESIKLHKESQRMQSESGVAGDEELARAEKSHSDAVKQFDADISQEASTDPDAHVSPESAGQVISDIATTTNASRGRKSAPKPTSASGVETPDASDAASSPSQSELPA